MEVFGLTIGEVITLLASAIALIITIARAGQKDVTTESVEHLLEPLNERNAQLCEDLEKSREDFEAFRKRNQAWKAQMSKKVTKILAEMDELKQEIDKT